MPSIKFDKLIIYCYRDCNLIIMIQQIENDLQCPVLVLTVFYLLICMHDTTYHSIRHRYSCVH